MVTRIGGDAIPGVKKQGQEMDIGNDVPTKSRSRNRANHQERPPPSNK